MTARVYVATDLARLGEWHAAGVVPAAADRVVADAADEDAEYDALMTAADAAPDQRRRVVVVAETGGVGDGELRLADWVALHCDVAERPDGDDPDDELAWFATQEIPDLLRGASRG